MPQSLFSKSHSLLTTDFDHDDEIGVMYIRHPYCIAPNPNYYEMPSKSKEALSRAL